MLSTGGAALSHSDEGLVKAIGPLVLTFSIVNMIIGAGILMLPALVAREVGRAAPLAYLLAAAVMVLVTLCFLEAGAQTSTSGGPYAYATAAFGPYVGYMTGMLLWASCVLANAAVSVALVSWVGSAVPWLASSLVRTAVIVGIYATIVAVNLRGVRAASGFASAASICKVSVLVLVVLLGLRLVNPAHVVIEAPRSFEALGRAAMLLILAFSGMETALGASGEIRTPARTVPIALAASTLLVVVLYAALQFVAQGALGDALGSSTAPLADALRGAGTGQHRLILVGGAISMLGFVAGDLLGASRVLFAVAAAGRLPAVLAYVSPSHHVPSRAVLTHGGLACLLALSGTYDELAIFASLGTVLLYIVCCAAAWKLAHEGQRSPLLTRAGRLGWLVPLAAIVSLTAILLQSSWAELRAAGIAVAAATGLYSVPWTAKGTGPRNAERGTRS